MQQSIIQTLFVYEGNDAEDSEYSSLSVLDAYFFLPEIQLF